MVHKRYNVPRGLLALISILALLFAGCDEKDETLGLDLIPGSDLIKPKFYQESDAISAFTFTDPKIRVDNPGFTMFGSFNDPLFGQTNADFAAQFRMSSYPDFGDTPVCDSVVLSLVYRELYGDTLTEQSLNVYELDEALNPDALYYSSFDLKSLAGSLPLGAGTYTPKQRIDSTGQDTTVQEIRIKLDQAFAEKLFYADSLDMINNNVFLEYFKGLYVESQPVDRKGALVYLKPSASRLYLHYHNADSDSLAFLYSISSHSANVSAFEHDFSNAIFVDNLDQEVVEDTLLFIQPNAGTRAKINIPSLGLWADSTDYIINKATVTFHVDTLATDYQRYRIPSRLYLKYIDDEGEEAFPKDSEIANSYYGGFFNPFDAVYTFNITQHLQEVVGGNVENHGFYLVPSDRKGDASRVVLKGSNSSEPIELKVTYTRYK